MTTVHDVAVVGCGPVGGLAANLFARAGLSTLVIEPNAHPHPLPRAVHMDHEAMRIFDSAGLSDRLEPLTRDTDGHLHLGADGGVIRYLGTTGLARRFGWSNDYFFYQPELEAVLREGVAEYSRVTLEFGSTLASLNEEDDAVRMDLEDGREHRARWVVACDGASSGVRRMLGLKLDDLRFDEPWLVVDAEVKGPISFPPIERLPPGVDPRRLSVMVCDPRRPSTVVPGRGDHRRWEFMLLPGEDEEAMRDVEVARRLVAPWVRGVPHEIIRCATYRFHGLVAEHWRKGRVFLAGDAAHQTPPFFGQGMCHGLRDAANLAWKLKLVCADAAEVELLDTYQPERERQVRGVISRAVEVGRTICELDAEQAAARDARLRGEGADKPGHAAPDIIPPLVNGVVAEGGGPRFIQPHVETLHAGRVLLDDATGGGWRLFVRDLQVIGSLGPRARAVLDALEARVFSLSRDDPTAVFNDTQGALLAWLDDAGADAVIVRPDFYVFGAAPAPGVDHLLRELGCLCRLTHAFAHGAAYEADQLSI